MSDAITNLNHSMSNIENQLLSERYYRQHYQDKPSHKQQHQKHSYCTEDRFLMPKLDVIEMTDYHHGKHLASETHQHAEKPLVTHSHPKQKL